MSFKLDHLQPIGPFWSKPIFSFSTLMHVASLLYYPRKGRGEGETHCEINEIHKLQGQCQSNKTIYSLLGPYWSKHYFPPQPLCLVLPFCISYFPKQGRGEGEFT